MNRILVVEDMAIFREPIAATLRKAGYEVYCADNGIRALEQAVARRPHLILLDIAMPDMDGLTCLRTLRADPFLRNVPVIMLTAMGDQEAVMQAAQNKVEDYLLKSEFSLDQLLLKVREHISGPPLPATENRAQRASTRPDTEPNLEETSKARPATPLSQDRSDVLKTIRRELRLHAMPPVLVHVLALSSSTASSIDEIASAVRQDPALAFKLMKIANSGFYGKGKPLHDLAEAAQRIGLSAIRNTLTAILTMEHFATLTTAGIVPQRFWEHSLTTALFAQLLAQANGLKSPEQLFLAGLLHDIGRMALSTVFIDDYQTVLVSAADRNIDLLIPEQEVFGLTHADVTRELLADWRIPESIFNAAWPHGLSVRQVTQTVPDPQGALVVSLANRLAHALALGDSGNAMLLPIKSHTRAAGLSEEALHAVIREVLDKTHDIRSFYGSLSDEPFCKPLSDELAQEAGGEHKCVVFANDAPCDPLSLFCRQLGWLDSLDPSLALLYACDDTELAVRFGELEEFEHTLGTKLPILIASPASSIVPPADLVLRGLYGAVRIPGRYANIVETIVTFRRDLSP